MRTFFVKVAPCLVGAGLLALAGCGGPASGAGDQSPSDSLLPATVGSEVLGILNGEEITLEDLTDQDRSKLAQLRTEYYTGTHKLLEEGAVDAAREQLLLAAAMEKGMTLNQYYTNEIGIPEVSDEELQHIYNQNRGQFGGRTLDEIGTQLRRQVANQKMAQKIEATGNRFLREAEWDLKVPAYRISLESEGHNAVGPDSASAELVIFSCFECPYCRRFNETVDQIREDEELASQVRVVFRHFPLRNMHPMAQKAHEASVCAEDQGKFWEFHDALWTDDRISADSLEQHAMLIGLDTEAFAECLNSGSGYDRVQADFEEAIGLGLTGTPTVFLNGRDIGGMPFNRLKAEIERELGESN